MNSKINPLIFLYFIFIQSCKDSNGISEETQELSISTNKKAIQLSMSHSHTCAKLGDGTLKCWGSNSQGQLGNGTQINSFTPVSVTGLDKDITAFALGSSDACAVLLGGALKCWGNSYAWRLPGSELRSLVPEIIFDIDNGIKAVALGGNHGCGIFNQGNVKCWGSSNDGTLGNGDDSYIKQPLTDIKLSNYKAISISAGYNQTCIVTDKGHLSCWGGNYHGELGNGTTNDGLLPSTILNFGVTVVAANILHTCAVQYGKAKCWGFNNHGQIGDGTRIEKLSPVLVNDLTNVLSVATGYKHSCALLGNGSVKCWGGNDYGQLGNGGNYDSLIPTSVSGLDSQVVSIAAAGHQTCAVLRGNSVKCWGYNYYGQLGNNSTANSTVPVDVVGLK